MCLTCKSTSVINHHSQGQNIDNTSVQAKKDATQ
jgi:hypothetical protein